MQHPPTQHHLQNRPTSALRAATRFVNMRLLVSLCCFSLLGATIASFHRHSPLTGDSHPLLRRWYGVQPSSGNNDNQGGHTYPWPVRCTNPQYYQPICYCFKDQRSANNLHDILLNAISVWAHAIEATALSVDLLPPAGGDAGVLCGDQRLVDYRDALVISDETEDRDDSWNQSDGCQTATTVGYQ